MAEHDVLEYHEIGPQLLENMFRILHLNRGFQLEPGKSDDIVECNLTHVDLTSHPTYIAISYCWDIPQPRVAITCNGKKLHIRNNLHKALVLLRDSRESGVLWADAICINQNNHHERGQQVELMKDIFQSADKVIVWLGPEADNSDVGIQAARDLAEAGREYLKHRDSLERMPEDELWRQLFGKFKERSEWNHRRFHALSQIIDRNWFSRTWIVQEVALAKNITMLCGKATISWEDMMAACIIQNQLDVYTSDHDRDTAPLILYKSRRYFQEGIYSDLLSILYRHRLFDATDPRDKCYGLGALASDSVGKHFMSQIDYTLDPFVLYRQIATEMLKAGTDLNVLSIPPGLAKEHAPELPTWVPDWRTTRKSPCLGLLDQDDIHEIRYRASCDSQPSIQFDETGMLLGLECQFFDEIEAVSTIMVVDDLGHGFPGVLRLPKIAYMFDDWRKVTRCQENISYPTSENILDAFIDTLVGGHPDLTHQHKRSQYGIVDRQARLLRWYRRLSRLWPTRGDLPLWFVPYLTKLFKIPEESISYAFGIKTCPAADRTMFRTKKGYVGMATVRAGPGDRITIAKGGKVPLLLRPYEGETWKLRSDCYVHGIMDGSAYDESKLALTWIA
jgi:hypothetical protein